MCVRNWNENSLNPLSRIHWRASLVPAAAVIPAPIAYIKVVVVKKLVVGSQFAPGGVPFGHYCSGRTLAIVVLRCPSSGVVVGWLFTLKKLECSKQACA